MNNSYKTDINERQDTVMDGSVNKGGSIGSTDTCLVSIPVSGILRQGTHQGRNEEKLTNRICNQFINYTPKKIPNEKINNLANSELTSS